MAAEFMEAEKVVKTAKPADLIEFKRGIYQHWAIYVGGGDIVNFGSDSTGTLLTQDKSLVKYEKLTEVADSDLCRVNNRLDDKYPPRKTYLVLRDALQMVDQEVPYSVVSWNCEHFVTGLRYGKPESGQVRDATKAAVLAVTAVSGILALGATLVAALKENKEESDETEKKQEQEQQKV